MSTLLVSLVLVAATTTGIPEGVTPLECGIERPTPKEDFLAAVNMENGMEVFLYDSNHDLWKRPDFELLVPIGDENRYPLFYRIDRDYDGDIDIVYIDERRDGTCKGIRVYWVPARKNPNRHEGTPIDPFGPATNKKES